MHTIHVTNVNDALAVGLKYIVEHGVPEPSRNGPVLVAPTPVVTAYSKPWERVLFSHKRDANPFFHLMESLWMLSGRNDIAFPKMFNSRMGAYSDDGTIQRGAYGHRWREWFGYDQLVVIVKELRENPASRRCVLAMWDAGQTGYFYDCPGTSVADDPSGDLLANTVDKPCNTHIYFRVNKGRLDMTVCCRSNDILWGAYGANVVHMSMLQEMMAAWIGVDMGVYYQLSNNFHLYTDLLSAHAALEMAEDASAWNHYQHGELSHKLVSTPMINVPGGWFYDLDTFIRFASGQTSTVAHTLHDPFFTDVAYPMLMAWRERKAKTGDGWQWARKIAAADWRIACLEWLKRREKAVELG